MSWFSELWNKIKTNHNNVKQSFQEQQNKKNLWFTNMFSSLVNKTTGAGLTAAESATMNYNANEAEKNRQFQEQLANTTYQRTVNDLRAAGLNPALAYNNTVNPTPSGSSASVGMPSSGSNLLDAILQLKNLSIQEKVANSQVNLNNANANKVTEETIGIGIDNAFREELNKAELESRHLGNNLTKYEIGRVKKEMSKLDTEIANNKATLDNIHEQNLVLQSQKALNEASAKQIVEMLPFSKKLSNAQNDSQKAMAALHYIQAGYEKRLYTDDYVNAVFKLAEQNANDADARAFLSRAKQDLLNGEWLDFDENDSRFVKSMKSVINIAGATANAITSTIGNIIKP